MGFRRTAQITALAAISSGETLIPAKSGEFFSRLTNSIVLVASRSTNTLTCGAENALLTIAFAIDLRTPFTGMISSRSSPHSGVWMLRNTLTCDACLMTSSRVTSPIGPVATTSERSTPRSLASLRIGGFVMVMDPAAAGAPVARCGAAAVAARGAAGVEAAVLRRRDPPWPLTPYPTSTAPDVSSCGATVDAVSATIDSSGPAGAVISTSAPSELTEMMGVPTSTVCPSSTSRAETVPANGDGSSTSDFAVSISTRTWLMTTVSPALTFHETISASVSPSPTSGSVKSELVIFAMLLF